MSRAKEQEKVHALRDRQDAIAQHQPAKKVIEARARSISIVIAGDSEHAADMIDKAFGMAREAARTGTHIDKKFSRRGIQARVIVDP